MWRDSDSFALTDRKRASTRSLDPTWECRLRRPCRESRAFKSLDSSLSDPPSNYLILKTPTHLFGRIQSRLREVSTVYEWARRRNAISWMLPHLPRLAICFS